MTDMSVPHSTIANEPVTVSVSRRVQPGREADFEEWLRGISAAASKFEGQQGLSILRPSEQTGGRYLMIYRFDTLANASAWENSPERAQWIAKLEGISSEDDMDRNTATGLEVWFDLPTAPAQMPMQPPLQPPRHKMAVVLIVVIFGLVFGLQIFLGPLITNWPRWFQTLTIVTIQVLAMTYLIMPVINMLLKGWLFRKQG